MQKPKCAEQWIGAIPPDVSISLRIPWETAVNLDGKQPFDYAGIAAYEALTAIQSSLQVAEKRGRQ